MAAPEKTLAREGTQERLLSLRARLRQAEGSPTAPAVLPASPVLTGLLPGGGLRPGSVYSSPDSLSLLLALLAAPSRSGAWCAVVGVPGLAAEAAEAAGIALDRLVLVPDPGEHWLTVTATLLDAVPLVAVRPSRTPSPSDAARLSARLREREGVLLSFGDWPQAEATLRLSSPRWHGLGHGHGRLLSREGILSVEGRRLPAPRRARVLLPGPAGALVATAERAGRPATPFPVPLAERRRATG